MSSPVEAPATTLVSDWGFCPVCDAVSYRSQTCRSCTRDAQELWGDPNGISQKRAEERARQRYRRGQQRSEQQRRRKRLEARLATKGRGVRQRALRTVIAEKQARSYTFTLGCDEVDLGTSPSNTAHVVTSLEGTWLQRAGERLPRREHRNAHGHGNQRRCPGATGAQPWVIKGLTEQQWRSLALTNDAYGVELLGGTNKRRSEGALRWAKNWARIGNRSSTCHWLSRRCITAGLTEGQAEQMIERWYEKVPQGPGRHAYTLAEAMATLRSARRRYDAAKDRQREWKR